MISEYEAERWRQLSDELSGQVQRLQAISGPKSRAEWQAIIAIGEASRSLFGAFGAVMRENA